MKSVIIIVSVIGLAAVVGAIVVGTTSFDGLVVDKPYDRGLAWDREQDNRASLGWTVMVERRIIKSGGNEVAFKVLDREGKPLSNAYVSVQVKRPSTTIYDKTYTAAKTGGGAYTAEVVLPLHGYWDLHFTIVSGKNRMTFVENIFVMDRDGRP